MASLTGFFTLSTPRTRFTSTCSSRTSGFRSKQPRTKRFQPPHRRIKSTGCCSSPGPDSHHTQSHQTDLIRMGSSKSDAQREDQMVSPRHPTHPEHDVMPGATYDAIYEADNVPRKHNSEVRAPGAPYGVQPAGIPGEHAQLDAVAITMPASACNMPTTGHPVSQMDVTAEGDANQSPDHISSDRQHDPDIGSPAPPEDPDDSGTVTWKWRAKMLRRMLAFMLPALTIPLADPLMSIVDTVCIGQFAGTQQLAALGPANVVFMMTLYLFFPLQIATTRIVGSAIAEDRVGDAQNVLQSVLLIAAVFGVLTGGIFELLADPILNLMGAQPTLVPLASQYLRIRAAAQPAVLFLMVSQSALLAQRDSLAPALVVMIMAAANAAGNGVFVAGMGLGLVGAATTTVVTQYAGAAGMLWALQHRGKVRPGLRVPRLSELSLFLRTVGPLGVVSISKNLAQLLIQSTAAALPTLQLAAHQATLSLWMFCVMLAVPIEQAAYSFLPATPQRPQMLAVVQMLLMAALVCGLCGGGVVAALTAHLPSLFTQDTAVWPFLQSLQLQILLSLVLAILDISSSGILVVRGHLWYLAGSTCITLAAVGAALHLIKPAGAGLETLWWVQVLFYGVRAVQNVGRLVISLVARRERQPR